MRRRTVEPGYSDAEAIANGDGLSRCTIVLHCNNTSRLQHITLAHHTDFIQQRRCDSFSSAQSTSLRIAHHVEYFTFDCIMWHHVLACRYFHSAHRRVIVSATNICLSCLLFCISCPRKVESSWLVHSFAGVLGSRSAIVAV